MQVAKLVSGLFDRYSLLRNNTWQQTCKAWASAEIFPGGDNVNILLIFLRLMMMQ